MKLKGESMQMTKAQHTPNGKKYCQWCYQRNRRMRLMRYGRNGRGILTLLDMQMLLKTDGIFEWIELNR